MKKLLSLVLAIVLILTMAIPSLATEVQTTDYDQLIAIAKQVFPEHADKLNGNNNL